MKKSIINSYTDEEFIELFYRSNTLYEFYKNLGYSGKRLSDAASKSIKERCILLQLSLDNFSLVTVSKMTKKDLFSSRANWQSARSAIRKDAKRIFDKNNGKYICAVCGYINHCELAHIKSVSSFDDDSLIQDINDFYNLIPLCPNHHWEYDNGLLNLDTITNKPRHN